MPQLEIRVPSVLPNTVCTIWGRAIKNKAAKNKKIIDKSTRGRLSDTVVIYPAWFGFRPMALSALGKPQGSIDLFELLSRCIKWLPQLGNNPLARCHNKIA